MAEDNNFGIPPSIEDRVWLMENGYIAKDEKLIAKYHSAKRFARQTFLEEMKEVDGFRSQ